MRAVWGALVSQNVGFTMVPCLQCLLPCVLQLHVPCAECSCVHSMWCGFLHAVLRDVWDSLVPQEMGVTMVYVKPVMY